MGEKSWRVNKPWWVGCASVIVAFLCIKPVVDLDLGWHLMTGKFIVEKQIIPTTDLFSYSLPDHEYIAHSWLFDVITYVSYQILGLSGVNFVYIVIVITSMWSLTLASRRWLHNKELSLVIFLLTPYVLSIIGLRSLLVSFLGLSAVWWLITKIGNEERRALRFGEWLRSERLWILPIFFWTWSNLHGGFVLGLGLLGLWLGCKWSINVVQEHRLPVKVEYWLMLLGLIVIVTLINPYGWKVYEFGLSLVTNQAAASMNADWLPLLSNRLPQETLGLRLSLVMFGAVVIIGLKKKFDEKLLLSILLGLTLWKIRFGIVLLVVLLPLMVSFVEEMFAVLSNLKNNQVRWGVVVGGIVLVGINLDNMKNTICANSSAECYAKEGGYPIKAVEYLKSQPGLHNVFNYYNWGGYLIWKMPEKKYFIDGRMDNFLVDGQSFLNVFGEIERSDEGYEEKIMNYGTDAVLIPSEWKLAKNLEASELWQVGYRDSIAVVLERKDSQ